MSVSHHESRVKQARSELARQRARRDEQEQKATKAEAEALRHERSARSTKSASLAASKRKQAERKRDEANKAKDKAVAASKAVTAAQKKVSDAEQKLEAEKAKQERKARDKEDRERKKTERERQRREQARERELSSLRSQTAQLTAELQAAPWANAPEEITVLFIASSPEDQEPLRLDREVREIHQRVRMSEHREAVRFEWRPAARLSDLLQYLNEVRPHVVHFSGHGDQHALAFEDADGTTKPLDNATLAALLHATSDRIRLGVFNSCESSAQAEPACEHIDAAIGMEQSVEDEAAKVFAGQFYNSVGFAKALQQAFDQAKAQLRMVTGGLSGNPQLYAAPGLDPAEVFLVAPPNP